MDKKLFISKIANTLSELNITMNIKQLTELLNWNGITTDYGEPYKGKRGTYKLIHSVYDYLIENKRIVEAENVAKSFKRMNGTYAYQK